MRSRSTYSVITPQQRSAPAGTAGVLASRRRICSCRASRSCGAPVATMPPISAPPASGTSQTPSAGNPLGSHADDSTQSHAEVRAELKRTAGAIRAAGGARPRLVRPPYHRGPHEVASAARWLGVKAVVLRSIAVSDWAAESEDEVF